MRPTVPGRVGFVEPLLPGSDSFPKESSDAWERQLEGPESSRFTEQNSGTPKEKWGATDLWPLTAADILDLGPEIRNHFAGARREVQEFLSGDGGEPGDVSGEVIR
jgi:hypothetical protein